MPSGTKTKRKKSRKKSELDSALGQVTDESIAASMKEFQDLLDPPKRAGTRTAPHSPKKTKHR
ncbi:MAG: hypothetical protein DME65_00490 [Verrucomicrobia bacterium]|nr:MAG: hypothetical protein DME65_00490 [Verrucomicrobiota bacterium]